MDTITFLQNQLVNINANFHRIAGDISEQEWLARPAPGQNLLGFTVWHIPRTQDTHVQTWVRGLPELAHGERWAQWRQLKQYGYGVGITLAEADGIAQRIRRDDVMEYADAVLREISAWLGELGENGLDQLPDYRRRLVAYPEYQTPGYLAEISDLLDQPVWGQLMRPCIGHIHRHLGEVEALKGVLRS